MWELTSLESAFSADNRDCLIAKVGCGDLGRLPESYSPEWVGLVKSMLLKAREDRATVAGLLASHCMQVANLAARHRIAEVCRPDALALHPPVLLWVLHRTTGRSLAQNTDVITCAGRLGIVRRPRVCETKAYERHRAQDAYRTAAIYSISLTFNRPGLNF